MDEKLNINVTVAGHLINLGIERDQEELLRAAAKRVNEEVNQYTAVYGEMQRDRLMTLVALDMAYQHLDAEHKNDTQPVMEVMNKLSDEIEDLVDIK